MVVLVRDLATDRVHGLTIVVELAGMEAVVETSELAVVHHLSLEVLNVKPSRRAEFTDTDIITGGNNQSFEG